MDAEELDTATKPFIRVALCLGALVLAIFLVIIGLYRGPPVPSPYGCYQGTGSPLVRLLPGRIIVSGAHPIERKVKVATSKQGYILDPGFAFAAGDDGTLRPVSSNLLMLIYAQPNETPNLQVSVDEIDDVVLPQVACPAPL